MDYSTVDEYDMDRRKSHRMRRQYGQSYKTKSSKHKRKPSGHIEPSWMDELFQTIWNREFMIGFASIGELFLGLAIPYEVSSAPRLGALVNHSLLHTVAGGFCVSMGTIGLGSLKYQLKTTGAVLYGIFLFITAIVLLSCILVNLTLFTHYDLSLPHGHMQERLGGNYSAALYEHTMSADHTVVNAVGPMLGLAMVLVAVLMAMTCTGSCFVKHMYTQPLYQLVHRMVNDDAVLYENQCNSYKVNIG